MSDGSSIQKFFAALLIGVGVLIAGLSGLCSVVLLGSGMGREQGALSMILLFGGAPFVFGAAAIVTGVVLWRAR